MTTINETSLCFFEHGKRLPEPFLSNRGEGFRIGIDRNNGLMIIGSLSNLSRQEVRGLKKARITLGLLSEGDAIIFTIDIEGIVSGDMPYDHSIPPLTIRGLPERTPKQGFLIPFIVADTVSGTIRSVRAFTISPAFSNVIESELLRLDGRVASHDWHYSADIGRAEYKYSATNSMTTSTVFRETVGKPFPKD
jgi:hypothetical protein